MASTNEIVIIDISALLSSHTKPPSPEAVEVAKKIYAAFSTLGFCQFTGHDIPVELQADLVKCSQQFFALPEAEKSALHVKNGGIAWRVYAPLGGESTHGRTDWKEGIYFGPEHPADHPHAGMLLHGANQFPDASIPAMRGVVQDYVNFIIELGKIICDGLSSSLGLEKDFIRENYLQPEPVALFRCWSYPGISQEEEIYGIGEHSGTILRSGPSGDFAIFTELLDFGFLTILKQMAPGLQFLTPQKEWIDVPVVENALICNVGDMLDRMTVGRFISARHRVLPPAPGTSRLSFPFFFDYSWTAKIRPFPLSHLPALPAAEDEENKVRWGTTTFTNVEGEWWQYLAKKVKKVFPDLVLPDFDSNIAPSSRFTIAVPVVAK
ncbi:hypothetical protein HETIRDRAFT_451742 [Heterobasidion irregulare TC 32-1]|uniref:Fe2OG dioxygenase domain-containing protein n=1 Tax=Heterobasidion irregulare (strain TC 32-1) TaxID=747525 RepID=W4KAM7_HETIT|nr:uncharacterized protein HETIRDRAFT_451742 [Heterobasidion irregulare TC 32-1]ETW82141.1 hypothetical protein HETIRDRAFT_451742 [Heterobasidion irregulare TC 32-1]